MELKHKKVVKFDCLDPMKFVRGKKALKIS